MRKSLAILFAVALIGGASVYAKKHDSGNSSVTAMPSASQTSSAASTDSSGRTSSNSSRTLSYRDGTYKGGSAETPYGAVQIAATISGGKITDIQFLQMPKDENHSREVTAMAEPLLKKDTLNKQSASGLDMVSGATSTYYGYQESLQAALDQAKLG
jgi:uncharacterized protein with FMN-binding domain